MQRGIISTCTLLFIASTAVGCGTTKSSNVQPQYPNAPTAEQQMIDEQTQHRDRFVASLQTQELADNQYRTLTKDIDGDGTPDTIQLSVRPYNQYETITTLSINTSTITVRGENPSGFFGILDIDTADQMLEVAVSDDGPSSDYTAAIYQYIDGQIVSLGVISGRYTDMTLDGHGRLTAQTRAPILDTWFYTDTYELTADRQFIRVPKSFYEREMPAVTIIKPLELFTNPDTKAATRTTLPVGTETYIVGCDLVAWCAIDLSDGTRGWFQPPSDLYEYFEGLSFAD